MNLPKHSPCQRLLSAALLVAAVASGPLAHGQQADADIATEQHSVRGFAIVQGVNTRTGNFARTYQAFDGHALAYQRTYNSQTANQGTFGLAWGSSLDTRAVPMADGRVAVLEGGNGAITLYGPGPAEETRLQMEQAVAEATQRPTASTIRDIGKTLSIESPFVLSAATRCENAQLTLLAHGFVRTACEGSVEVFNPEGRLVGRTDLNGSDAMVRIVRDATGQITQVSDDAGHQLRFVRRPLQLLVTSETGDWVKYAFDRQGRNTAMTHKDRSAYWFDYGSDDLMRQIRYIDSTSIQIDYEEDRIRRLTLREGDVYEFDYLPQNQTQITLHPYQGTASRRVVHHLE